MNIIFENRGLRTDWIDSNYQGFDIHVLRNSEPSEPISDIIHILHNGNYLTIPEAINGDIIHGNYGLKFAAVFNDQGNNDYHTINKANIPNNYIF